MFGISDWGIFNSIESLQYTTMSFAIYCHVHCCYLCLLTRKTIFLRKINWSKDCSWTLDQVFIVLESSLGLLGYTNYPQFLSGVKQSGSMGDSTMHEAQVAARAKWQRRRVKFPSTWQQWIICACKNYGPRFFTLTMHQCLLKVLHILSSYFRQEWVYF